MSPFLLGVSLSSWNRVLGRTLTLAHGEASGFFVPGRHLVRDRQPPEVAMLLSDCPVNHRFSQPEILSSGCFRHIHAQKIEIRCQKEVRRGS